jgi:hypothetical protein
LGDSRAPQRATGGANVHGIECARWCSREGDDWSLSADLCECQVCVATTDRGGSVRQVHCYRFSYSGGGVGVALMAIPCTSTNRRPTARRRLPASHSRVHRSFAPRPLVRSSGQAPALIRTI